MLQGELGEKERDRERAQLREAFNDVARARFELYHTILLRLSRRLRVVSACFPLSLLSLSRVA